MPPESVTEHKHGGLGELPATAICGNDITSSCLYVSALAILQAGKWAPLVLLFVVGVLYLFRKIYSEVVGALPLNGGAYNALLNTTSKFLASLAACLTLLSYMATAVISANEAVHYAHSIWQALPLLAGTIVLLGFFTALASLGIQESSRVAVAIFLFHILTLSVLILAGVYFITFNGLDVLVSNFRLPTEGSLGRALIFGFAAAMLGISGFESSANFVEEQAEGIFPKTLRNMWIVVTIFNPGIALLALALVAQLAVLALSLVPGVHRVRRLGLRLLQRLRAAFASVLWAVVGLCAARVLAPEVRGAGLERDARRVGGSRQRRQGCAILRHRGGLANKFGRGPSRTSLERIDGVKIADLLMKNGANIHTKNEVCP